MAAGIVFVAKMGRMGRMTAACVLAIVLGVPLGHWQSSRVEIVNENTAGFRQAAADAVRLASPVAAYAAFGSARELFGYYADRPVVILKSSEDLRMFQARNREYVCFVIPGLWEDVHEEPRMLEDLRPTAHEKKYEDISVYYATRQGSGAIIRNTINK